MCTFRPLCRRHTFLAPVREESGHVALTGNVWGPCCRSSLLQQSFTLSACLYANQMSAKLVSAICESFFLCVVREKPDRLEIVALKDSRDPVERRAVRDLLDLLEHRFVHRCCYLSGCDLYA